MSKDKQILHGVALLLQFVRLNREPKREKVRSWGNGIPWVITLVQEMRRSHRKEFFRCFCMSPERLAHLSTVGPRLVKDCRSREPISPGERLAVTIRFLASGDSQKSLYYAYRITCTSLSRILRETCQIIWEELSAGYLKPPKSELERLAISEQVYNSWNVPHAIGAIDGKHISMQCLSNSGSLYFFRHFHVLSKSTNAFRLGMCPCLEQKIHLQHDKGLKQKHRNTRM